jgi:hypothetical protein
MNGHRMNTYEIPDELVSFCRANLQQGPVQIAAATIGRVQGLNSLVRALVNPRSILDLDSAEALVRDLVADVVDPTTKLARQKSQLDGQTLSRFQMWSYPAADSLSPFREIGSTRAEAVNVLGLGYYADTEPNAELVRWAHTLPVTIRAHRPTAWDACADKGNVYWRPGGSTYKLHSDEYGLQEFVHNPVQGQDLTVPIEILL